MAKRTLAVVWILMVLAGMGWVYVRAAAETILFIGNSFTYGALSEVQSYRPETVTDLNHEGTGGVPALFASFTRQAGLHYQVHLELAGGANLDFHYEQKAALVARPWDHVVMQGYSTLNQSAPGDDPKSSTTPRDSRSCFTPGIPASTCAWWRYGRGQMRPICLRATGSANR